jgi:hypothetical protein
MPSSTCMQPAGHFSRIKIFCVIKRYVWHIACDYSMLWWHHLRVSTIQKRDLQTMDCDFGPLTKSSIDSKTTAAILQPVTRGSKIGIALPKPNAVRCRGHGGIATTHPSWYGRRLLISPNSPSKFVCWSLTTCQWQRLRWLCSSSL